MKRYIAAALVMVGVMMAVGRAGPLTATPTTVVVSPGHMNGWAIVDDNGAGGGSGSLVAGPAVPPAGTGSARLQVNAASAAWIFAAPYAATPLTSFMALSYSTYRSSADGGNNLAISLQFNIDYDLTDSYTGYQGRIVFEPYNTFPSGVPQGSWQTWNALAGKWWQTANPANPLRAPYVGNVQQAGPLPCPQSAPCTLATLIATYPNIGVHATLGAVVLKAGSNWTTFDGNADNLTIGTGAGTTIYDFEGDCTTDCYVRTDGNDANTGLADTASQAKKTIQASVNQVSAGGTVHVAAGTYVEQVDIGKQLTLDGAGAGRTIIQAPATLATKFTTSAANKPVVYVHASGGTISHLTVDGNGVGNLNNRLEGIAFYNAGGTVSNSAIVHVRETPLSGTQHGVALYANNADAMARTLTVTNNTISDYQKNGMALNGAGLTATVSGNVVTGAGATPLTAQNGIQIGFGAVGSITGNTVSGDQCTVIADCTADPSSAANADGAAGILIYTPGSSTITIQNNVLTANQFGVWTVGATSLNVDGNTISGVGGSGVAVWNCDQGCGPADGVGTTGSITNNTISGQAYGLLERDFVAGPGVAAVPAHNNSITGSTLFGAWANTPIDATNNWWGSPSGPQHASNTFNVLLQGDKVSDNVTFVPWWSAAPPAGASFAPVTTTSPVGNYSSIQAGVNASASGGTVNAAAGTFTENVSVGTQVTIAGAGQALTTIVPAVSNPNCGGAGGGSLCAGGSNVILVGANNVTVHDLTLDGDNPNLKSTVNVGGVNVDARNGIITNHAAGVWTNLTVHHVTVKNVYLRGMYASSGGTFNFHDNTVQNVQADQASVAMFNFGGSGTMSNNTVSYANDAISANHSIGTQFLNNLVTHSGSGVHTDNAGDGGGVADLIDGNSVSDCATNGYGVFTFVQYIQPTVKRNVITNCAVGMAATGSFTGIGTLFQDNEVNGAGLAGSTGVYVTTDLFGFGTANVTATLTGNIVKNNDVGIDADSQAGYTTTINASRNAIFGNAAGVTLTDTPTPPVTLGIGAFTLNMTPNWWGDASGPANATSNPAGTGNSVPNGVVYSPWLGIGTDSAPGAPGFQLTSPMTWIAGPAVCGATCIQAAIDDASNGDTIQAKSGVFQENITVTKELTLEGAGQASTTVVPAVSNPNCGGAGGGSLCAGASNIILVQADNVTIHDLTLDGNNPSISSSVMVGGSDIDARNGIITNHALGPAFNNLTVHHVTVKNIFLRGVYASSGGTFNFHDDTVQNVQAEYASIAMFNFGGAGTFTNNTVSGANDAISSNWSKGTQYLNNTITGSGSGVHTDNNGGSGGVADLIQGNSVSACKTDGYGVWTFAPYVSPTVAQNTVTGCAVGMAAAGQQAAVTTTFTDNAVDGTGALVSSGGSTGAYITTDLFGFGTANVSAVLTGNRVVNNGDGFYFDASLGGAVSVTATQNCIAGNTNSGMTAAPSVTAVNAVNNWWGTINGPNPPGHGDKISPAASLSVTPFLTAPVAGCPMPLDGDGDGAPDTIDNCPTVYNPDQANRDQFNYAANLPGSDSRGDACDTNISGDGYLDTQKVALGKNVSAYCAMMRADINGDGWVNGLDLAYIARYFTQFFSPTDPLNGLDSGIQRVNQNGDNVINGLDLAYIAQRFQGNVMSCP